MKKLLTAVISSVLVFSPAFPQNNDLFDGLVGGIIGGAIVQGIQNQNKQNSSNSGGSRVYKKSNVSSAERAANKQLQENLNYFGFDAGNPDGVLGRGSRTAVRKYQACLNRPSTGKVDTFEKQFLEQSALKAQARGMETLKEVSRLPNGYCGLLQKYMIQMMEAEPEAESTTTVAITQPKTANVVQNSNVSTQQTINVTQNTLVVNKAELQKQFDRITNQIKLLKQIQEHIRAKATSPADAKKLSAVELKLKRLQNSVVKIETKTESEYGVPIKPSNANLGVTVVKASEVFPRVPYYIPGTEETGELWIKPYVSDAGEMLYDFNFVQSQSEFDKIREKIVMADTNIIALSSSMVKINKWSEKAQAGGVRKIYQKTAYCFPEAMCAEKKIGNSSTEYVFKIYEDGATAASIRRNKGKFAQEYNLSVESGLLLAAYADYMQDLGSKEFGANTMTDKDLDNMFDD